MQLSNPFKPQGNKLESLESNELTVKIEVRSVPSRYLTDGNIRGLQTGSTIFYACTDTQKSIILQARKQALIESSSVVSHLTSIHQLGTTVDCPLHDEWFGTFDVTRFAELKNGYEELKNRLNDATIWFDCSCRKGWVMKCALRDTTIWPRFSHTVSCTHSNMTCNHPTAIMHTSCQISRTRLGCAQCFGVHRWVEQIPKWYVKVLVPETNDYAYGQGACQALADSNPHKAINNADSHKYLAENPSALACNPS